MKSADEHKITINSGRLFLFKSNPMVLLIYICKMNASTPNQSNINGQSILFGSFHKEANKKTTVTLELMVSF